MGFVALLSFCHSARSGDEMRAEDIVGARLGSTTDVRPLAVALGGRQQLL